MYSLNWDTRKLFIVKSDTAVLQCWIVSSLAFDWRVRDSYACTRPHFTFNLYGDANRWMRGADKSKKKRKRDVRAARRALTSSKSRRRTWRDFMPAKICRVIGSNMAVTSCKLSWYTGAPVPATRDAMKRSRSDRAGRQAGRQVSSRQVVTGTTTVG